MSEDRLFSFQQLSLGYGETVLQIEHLDIRQGEKIALLGISGSGKSTLLNHLYQKASIPAAYCPQQLGLVPILSVYHNIYMGQLDQHSMFSNLINLIKPNATEYSKIQSITETLGIQDKIRTSVDQLSGGQQQRTALGRAIYQQAALFLGDEPVSAVDDLQAAQLINLLNERHTTSIVALHDRELALAHFDRIIGLKKGQILIDSPTDQVSQDDLLDLYSV